MQNADGLRVIGVRAEPGPATGYVGGTPGDTPMPDLHDPFDRLAVELLRELPERVALLGVDEPACVLVVGWDDAPVPWIAVGLGRQRAALGREASRLMSRGDLLAVGPTSMGGGRLAEALSAASPVGRTTRYGLVADLVRRADAMGWEPVLPVADGFVVVADGQDLAAAVAGARAEAWQG